MTDCFVCKHPILEGQKDVPIYEQYVLDMEDLEVAGVAHANPADHLPTGFKTRQKQYAETLGQAYLKEEVRAHGMTIEEMEGAVRAERERVVGVAEWWAEASKLPDGRDHYRTA